MSGSTATTSSTVFSIRCYCGAVTLQANAAPGSFVNCRCGQCRRLSGAAFTSWASFAREAIPLSGNEPLTAFKVSDKVTRHFCRVCGSHVFTFDGRLPKILGVPAGAIEGSSLAPPSAHYFVDHKAAWYDIGVGQPRFGGESGVQPLAS
ncbi:GFA family protein [Roseateles sp. DAIF2]|uniref:GFA family protein n=1 Tax=Roseateles sp. DAIF2 TaxID=2714952 RepID=UPI0018A2AA80|nr:GFA family protein [Roseateles sp. DAIF2]QPF72617.1 GFA family protein [Roseateles sp. DAIF2]